MKWALRLYAVLIFWGLLVGFALHHILVQTPAFSLQILHTNDHHAHLEAVEVGQQQLGGIARRKTLIDQIRQQRSIPTLLLDAGDIFQGTLYFNQYLGEADLPFYNALNYAAVAVGNHEFDQGQTVLANFIQQANFPLLSANLEIADDSPLKGLIQPWVIEEIEGERIGIFGLTTPETAILSSPGVGIQFKDEVKTARQAVAELSRQGVNKIIALTHLGLSHDLALAQQVNGIDIIIGGHSHTPLGSMPGATQPYPIVAKTPKGETVLVATDWEWGKYLGNLSVRFDPQGHVIQWRGSAHIIDHKIQPDSAFLKQLQAFQAPLKQLRQKVIGQTRIKLEGDRIFVRTQSTNLGNLITDAILTKLKADGAQVAIMNGGGIRASIPAGSITVGQVLEVLPFGNTMTRLDLTGEQLKQALEHGVSQVESGKGGFPQVSGLQFKWNPTAAKGSRITEVHLVDQNGIKTPLNLTATYRVVTNNFLMQGGDGYEILKSGKNQLNTGFLLSDVVIDYILRQSQIEMQPDDRILAVPALSQG